MALQRAFDGACSGFCFGVWSTERPSFRCHSLPAWPAHAAFVMWTAKSRVIAALALDEPALLAARGRVVAALLATLSSALCLSAGCITRSVFPDSQPTVLFHSEEDERGRAC